MWYLNILSSFIVLFFPLSLMADSSIETVFGSGKTEYNSNNDYKSVQVFSSDSKSATTQKESVKVVTSGLRNLEPEKPKENGLFLWPVEGGSLSSAFGWRSGHRFHDGVDISAKAGTKVLASRTGKVIYCSNKIRGYGNMIVLKHNGGFYTVYSHNKQNLVKVGQQVEQGSLIAYVGRTGRATGEHLHFEIRKGKYSVDPMKYISIANNKTKKVSSEETENKMISTFTN